MVVPIFDIVAPNSDILICSIDLLDLFNRWHNNDKKIKYFLITFYLCLLRWPNPAGDKAVLKMFVCAPSGHFKWHTWVCEGLINTGKSDDPERKAESGKCITL